MKSAAEIDAYRTRMSQAVSQLIVDPFSALTRKRQMALLTAGTVTWLLVTELVKIKPGSVGDWNLVFTNRGLASANWLAGLVTLYLLVVYLLGVYADWTIAEAKRWSPLASIEALKAAMDSECETLAKSGLAENEQFDNLRREEKELAAAAAQSYEKYKDLAESKPRRAAANIWLELDHKRGERLAEMQRMTSKSLSNLDRTIVIFDDVFALDKMIGKFPKITRYRLYVEVWFPAGYALLALFATIVRAVWHFISWSCLIEATVANLALL